ncbi:MAG: hypothetical protein AABN33_15310 [Acidobacteriota bacterium]
MTQYEQYVIRLRRLPDGMEMEPPSPEESELFVALPVEVVLENGEKVELGPPTPWLELKGIYANPQEYIQAHRKDFCAAADRKAATLQKMRGKNRSTPLGD